jgi:hypothetical protein
LRPWVEEFPPRPVYRERELKDAKDDHSARYESVILEKTELPKDLT